MAVTWWGHSFCTVEMPGGPAVATDPLIGRTLLHLRRVGPVPHRGAAAADVVLISHLHHDHLHVPSLAQFGPGTPIVVPSGACRAVPSLARHRVVEASPGQRLEIAGVVIDVLPAQHDGRRDKRPGARAAPALGFRFTGGGASCWFPGDTGPAADFAAVDPVGLALVPIGGWGPSLGEQHLDPVQAVDAVARVGARWVLPVHYGTFWPVVLPRRGRRYERFFVEPPQRFLEAARVAGLTARVLMPPFGIRQALA